MGYARTLVQYRLGGHHDNRTRESGLRPCGSPRSASWTSLQRRIEPLGLVILERRRELLAHLVLTKRSQCCGSDSVDRCAATLGLALTGSSPLKASSGPRKRHRRNRGGDRDANAALDMIAVNRLANGHEPTRAYFRKRTGSNRADLDMLRRIKRYIAGEAFPKLRAAITHHPEAVHGDA